MEMDENVSVSKIQKSISISKDFISIKGISMDYVNMILESATEMKELVKKRGGDETLKHKILASIFYEPSTRTSCSFQAGILRL